MNKLLLWFTGILMLSFLFTFPTRDRRGAIDRIRLQVGATSLVSKKTLNEVAAEQRAADRKTGRTPTAVGDKFDFAGAATPLERQDRLNKTVVHYCNQQFNRQYCGQWLNRCGEMCRSMVNPVTWSTVMHTNVRKPAARQTPTRKTTVASAAKTVAK